MDSKWKVSVIIPVYQVEDYLERAVDSVLAQTLQETEIVLVDNGSQDGSGEICDAYAARYPERIQVIHKENEGLGMARNTGIKRASGEYLAFLDSDDTVDPQMYETMYQKAVEEDFDIVMCDVKIIYVEENRETAVSSYHKERVEMADYIVRGNNITYSVNKLFRREIWKNRRYKKMLFEDISLIPALMTRYPNVGYVPRPFYHYYRRANTLSTTYTGEMTDIIQAFRDFINESEPAYREEVIYCTARQLYWNMMQSRPLFRADFIELLKEYKKDFLLNSYLKKDEKVKEILKFTEEEVIPEQFLCVSFQEEIPEEYFHTLKKNFPQAKVLQIREEDYRKEELPPMIREAMEQGKTEYVREYYGLKALFEQGGMILDPCMRVSLNLKKLRLNRIFFGFENQEELTTGCFGALKGHYIIQGLLDSYEKDTVYNRAFLPLKERLRDFLIVHFQLKVNGRTQFLGKEVQIYMPNILSYDMQDGENCCKRMVAEVPEGYEVISSQVLQMWSDRLLNNWNLYKAEQRKKNPGLLKRPAALQPSFLGTATSREAQEEIEKVVNSYENSTCWKLTKPVRAVGKLLKK